MTASKTQIQMAALGLLTDALQIHVLELPKHRPSANNIGGALEQWFYFLQNADRLTAGEIERQIADPVFAAAAGVLEMISKSPDERRIFEGREKARRDEAARLRGAEDVGLQKGLQKGLQQGLAGGERVGMILLLEQLLGLAPSSREALAALDLAELDRRVAELQARYQPPKSL